MEPGKIGSDAGEVVMTKWTMVAMVAALAGCAGMRTMRDRDFASGHWIGEIDRDGSLQPFFLDIARENGAYRGQVQALEGVPGKPLENVEVQGDRVRFETDKLRFVGQIKGTTLAGTVTHKPEDAPVGEFSVTAADRVVYSPASEWSPNDVR
jgi:hypothetical protein